MAKCYLGKMLLRRVVIWRVVIWRNVIWQNVIWRDVTEPLFGLNLQAPSKRCKNRGPLA